MGVEASIPVDPKLTGADRLFTPGARYHPQNSIQPPLELALERKCPPVPVKPSDILSVLCMNVPCNTGPNQTLSQEWRENLFKHRAPFIAELFEFYQVDVACLQEPHEMQTKELARLLNDGFNLKKTRRDSDTSTSTAEGGRKVDATDVNVDNTSDQVEWKYIGLSSQTVY